MDDALTAAAPGGGSERLSGDEGRALVRRLAALARGSEPLLGPVRLVCIDGPAGSGKTTFAALLGVELGAHVVHVDDLLAGWGDLEGVWPRLRDQVLAPLGAGLDGRYRRYDWVAQEFAEQVDVPLAEALIIEGCGSARRAVDQHAVLKVWIEAPEDERLARGIARDGDAMRDHWVAWARDEAVHFEREGTRERADVIVDSGTGSARES